MNKIDNLLFRRQFIMGTTKSEKFPGWKEYVVGNRFFLYCHPDLDTNSIQRGEKELYILGYILDPYNPQLTNERIVDEIISNNEDFADVLKYTEKYGGRWVLIWKDKSGTKMMNDALGTRQVYFYHDNNIVWFGSQPSIIAYELELENDSDKELDNFIHSKEYVTCLTNWYGDSTIYKNLLHMLPNHFIDMDSLEIKRFWPYVKLGSLEIAEAVKESSKILEGTMKSITNKFGKVMLSVTAGNDSRIVLAASKNVSDKIKYFFCLDESNKNGTDHRISSQLLARLGLKQEIISKIPVDPEFLKIYHQNVTLASYRPGKEFIYAFYKNYSDYIHISSLCGEVAKNFFYSAYEKGTGLEQLISVSGYKGLKYVEKCIANWFDDAKGVMNTMNFYDLFFWENSAGNWAVKAAAEQDIAIEEVWPFNNRKLLTVMLSVKEKYRKPPFYRLQREIDKYLWKETLCKPINPNIKKKTLWVIRNSFIGISNIMQRMNIKARRA